MANPRPIIPAPDNPLMPLSRADFDDLRNILLDGNDRLERIMEGLNAASLRPSVDQVITINNQPQVLSRYGRRHNMLWVAASTSIQIDNLVGFGVFQLIAGWNPLEVSEGARVMSMGNQVVNGVYRATDFETSGAVV